MHINSIDYLGCPACNNRLRLKVTEQDCYEIVHGVLECLSCNRHFEIKDGLPDLTFPESLADLDLQSQSMYDRREDSSHGSNLSLANIRGFLEALGKLVSHKGRCPSEAGFGSLLNFKFPDAIRFFGLGIWEFALWETRARKQIIDRLELKKNDTVLETGVGTGQNLAIIAKQIGPDAQLDGMDLSSESLKVAHSKMRRRGIQVELVQGNASYLPYRTATFDAVLHMGAMDVIADQKRAISEMHRVAKPGAKIVISDEGLAPGKEKTWLGKWILNLSPVFAYKPPVEQVPAGIEDFQVDWVWQRTFWVMEFRKK
ncbi:MAG: methyltransferase domain-containing protein [Deltaproteobacteria bacterium]|nr:methyltransferase domain-containing protein [Deltaproteobacteria bacterium]MBW1987392.1 methyltransferase domain-containing protein [Deltaproteobacteria bacterium]